MVKIIEFDSDERARQAYKEGFEAGRRIGYLDALHETGIDIKSRADKMNEPIEPESETPDEPISSSRETSVKELDLSSRILNCFAHRNIHTIENLISYSADELSGFRNLGQKSLQVVIDKLAKRGLSLQVKSIKKRSARNTPSRRQEEGLLYFARGKYEEQ
jgi:DNA-directed RNA polymerase alpha subunit